MDRVQKKKKLDEFLIKKGLTSSDLLNEVETVYGKRLLVVATGSIIEGLGNSTSDIDLIAIIQKEKLNQFPIMSYRDCAKFDVQYYAETDISSQVGTLQDSWPPVNTCSYKLWRRNFRAIRMGSRMANGLALEANDKWSTFLSSLSDLWFLEQVSKWWYTEALRIGFAARLLVKHYPLLASFRYCDAVFASLSGRATAQGQIISARKWLPEKLKLLEDWEGLKIFTEAMQTPLNIQNPKLSYAQKLLKQALRTSMVVPDKLKAQLWYADGVNVFPLATETIVSRWNMRGCSIRLPNIPTPANQDTLVWEGHIASSPPDNIVELFCQGMLWLSLAETQNDSTCMTNVNNS